MKELDDVRLLLVDDIEDMRNIVRRLLGAMGFGNVTTARHGEEAWRMLETTAFDLVLCDWNMPKMSGAELLAKVRAEARLAKMPFIMITGENTSAQVKTAIASGVTDFIVKPFSASLLQRRLESILGLKLPTQTL